MRLKPYLTTIFGFLGWILHSFVRKVFITRYLVEREGLPAERTLTIKSTNALKVQSHIIVLMNCVPLITWVHLYL